MQAVCRQETGVLPTTLHIGHEWRSTESPLGRRASAKGRAALRLLLLGASAILISLAFSTVAQASDSQPNNYLLQFGSPGSGNGQFASDGPIGVATDPATDDVYVTDYLGGRVEKFDSSGHYLSEFGSEGSGPGQLNGPIGVGVNPANGDVYVADFYNDRVEKFDASGNYVSQFGTTGSGPGQFDGANCLAVDPKTGDVYVTDKVNSRVEKFDSAGNYLLQFGTAGGGNGQFQTPVAVAVDPSTHDVYVTDYFTARVQKFDSSGNYLSQFGTSGSGDGQLNGTYGVAVDPASSDVYVTDFYNNRVQRFDSSGNYLSQFGTAGSGPDQFNSPIAIGVDPTNRDVYVADFDNDRVEKFTGETNGTTTALVGSPNPALYGQAVALTATVSTSTDGPAPSGTVSFSDGGTPVGTGTLSSTGVAKLTVSNLTLGSHVITATYAGDTNNAGSVSSNVTETVRETPTGLCQLTVSDAESSAKYQALPNYGKPAINAILTNACNQLGTVAPKLTAKQLSLAIAGYNATVKVLAAGGWLSQTQVATLTNLAGNLTIA